MKAAVKLHSHRNPLMPAGWINANKSCHDGWCNIVMDNGITVTVTLEYLKRQSQKNDVEVIHFGILVFFWIFSQSFFSA